jgi:hypothetical protein
MSYHPLYPTWAGIKARCNNPRDPSFEGYGGRGIKVCAAWADDIHAFLRDMGPRPPGTSIDRIDNDGDYAPGNCRWATPAQQRDNSRTPRRYRPLPGTTPKKRKDGLPITRIPDGVAWNKDRTQFRAWIYTSDRRRLDLGTFDTAEEAVAARRAAEIKFPHFNRKRLTA